MADFGNFIVSGVSEISSGIFSMEVYAPQVAAACVPGQFVNLYTGDGGALLPRPISVCDVFAERGSVRLVFRVVGKGTRMFSMLTKGAALKMMGPLGNGFPADAVSMAKRVVLVGGGIGIPPLLFLARTLRERCRDAKITVCLGYRDNVFLDGEFKGLGVEVIAATEDGSAGHKGSIVGYAAEIGADIMYACGPVPMLRALKEQAGDACGELYISMEERMACGLGVCLGCAVKIRDGGGFVYKKVCKDGPVFPAGDVIF